MKPYYKSYYRIYHDDGTCNVVYDKNVFTWDVNYRSLCEWLYKYFYEELRSIEPDTIFVVIYIDRYLGIKTKKEAITVLYQNWCNK